MPNYTGLKRITPKTTQTRAIEGIKRLRAGLSEQIPARTATDTLLLATWNIREFDSGKYGWRPQESYYYIAEILSHFDIIAVQEIRDGLYPLQEIRKHLGSWWDFIVTDVTLGKSGNMERMAYLYDRRKVDFTGLAAELVLPSEGKDAINPRQLARTPYMAGFHAGWAYFTLATVHIYYGKSIAVDPRRLEEITKLAKTIAGNAEKLSSSPQYRPGESPVPSNLLILGDFNIFNRKDVTMQAITDAGFIVPDELLQIPGSNVAKSKHYDQIAYFKELARLAPTGNAGVFDFFEYVYQEASEAAYASERAEKPGRSFKDWRTYRMSDHLPMWIEFRIDDGDAYLDSIV